MESIRDQRGHALSHLREALEDLIRRNDCSIVFQPIVDLTNARVAGYEALARPDPSTIFAHAGELFEAVEAMQMAEEIEGLTRRKALTIAGETGEQTLLFLNNSAPVFTGDDFGDRISDEVESLGKMPPQRVVLEITEGTAHGLMAGLTTRSVELQERGFSIALDDVGAGISGLNQIMSLRPNWMKLDIELISGIDLDPLKQNLIRFFVHFARLGNMQLVAEGIEREEELRVLIELGVGHGQGFYLGRPGVLGAGIDALIADHITELCTARDARRAMEPSTDRIAALATAVVTCDVAEGVGEVGERLDAAAHARGLVVLDGNRYVGWIDKDTLRAAWPTGGDGALVGSLSITDCPLVGSDTTLSEALDIAAGRSDHLQTLPIIVQSKGRVAGMVTVRSLLMAAAETRRRAASHIAPLTGLPSRVQADRWLSARVRKGDRSNLAFIDLRDFDAFNVAYGFEKGDQLLMRLVGLIRSTLVEVDDGASFFAHLGEDRFMVAFRRDPTETLERLLQEFDKIRAEFFSSRDLATQAFCCADSFGPPRTYPLTTLRIVYLPGILQHVFDSRSIHFLVGRLRLRGDSSDGSAIITDRRAAVAESRACA